MKFRTSVLFDKAFIRMSATLSNLFKCLMILCFIHIPLAAEQIVTFYGTIEVEEPVLLELIKSPAFQRLKYIHQYGVSYYTTHHEEYNRYDHSLGVFAILRVKNASLKEQIAGLLHDISQTIFSHVGDWIYGKMYYEKDYHNSIHAAFLEKYGLGEILKKYNYTIDQILPEEHLFPMLEQKSPNLCADRIDYNIQGAFYQGFITYEEAMKILEDVQFIEGNWVFTNQELMKKMVRFSLFMTQDCWGSAANYLTSCWLAESIIRGVDLGYISSEEIHYGIDNVIWSRLLKCEDPIIQNKMQMIFNAEAYYSLVDPLEADLIVKSKFRGFDPWIISEGQRVRFTEVDPVLCKEYYSVKKKMESGWAIKLMEPASIGSVK